MLSCSKFAVAILLSTTTLVPFAAAAETAPAEAAGPPAVQTSTMVPGEILVTAQKRASTVQSTPVSMAAVSGAELQARGVVNATALAAATPGVSLKSEGPGQTEIEMRGMTASGGNSATVGFYLDDVPMTAPAAAQNGKVVIDPQLYDISRIETLRGPQGTLYGSGSMGGTIKLITNKPRLDAVESSAQITLSGTDGGAFNQAVNAMINVPLITDKLALRVVAQEGFTSGWIDRIVVNPMPLPSVDGSTRGDVANAPVQARYRNSNAMQTYGGRATLTWKPTDELTITPAFFFQTSRQNGINAYDSVPGNGQRYQPFDVAEPSTDRVFAYSLTVNYDFPGFELTSATSDWYRRASQTQDGSEDFNNPNTGMTYAANYGLANPGLYGPTGSGTVYSFENDPMYQFSEELRASSSGKGPLQWVVGGFFSEFHSTWNLNGYSSNPSAYMDEGTGLPATSTTMWAVSSPTQVKQYALFGQATYAITPLLKLTGGLRWYSYNYQFSEVFAGWGSALGAATPSDSGQITQKSSGLNPKFNLAYEFDRDTMIYATAAKGYRPGGGNAPLPTTGQYWGPVFASYGYTGTKWPSTYQSDSVWSYELGEKARFFDRHLTINASGYYEKWSNIQLESLPGDWPMQINGDNAQIYGGEIEASARLGGGFTLNLAGGYTHAVLNAGPHWQITPANVLTDVPKWTGDASLAYRHALDTTYTITARVDTSYVGSRYSLAFPYGYSLNGEYVPVPGYSLTNIRIGLESTHGWTLAAFANNLFNKRAELEVMLQESLPDAAFNRIVTNQPLTAGLDLSLKF